MGIKVVKFGGSSVADAIQLQKTKEIITFVLEADSEDDAREKVDDMCQKLLCNPIIHNYTINIIKMDLSCGCGCE